MNVIPFPNRPGTPQRWVAANSEVFFVAEERQRRRCSLCQKYIQSGQRYFGAYEMRFRCGDYADRYTTDRVVMRLHPGCANEVRG